MARCTNCGARLEEEEDSMQGSGARKNSKGEMVEVCNSCGFDQPIKKNYQQDVERDAELVLLARSGKYDDPKYDAGRFAWFQGQLPEYAGKVFAVANAKPGIRK